MKKALIIPAFALALVPLISSAATYHSGVAIDRGEIEPGTDVTSGVVAGASTDTSVSIFGTGGAATYAYVNQSGMTAMVNASSPETALLRAPNIDENSGVVIYVGDIEPGTPVPNVD